MTRLHTTLSSLLAATVFSMAGGTATQAHAQGATPAADATATSDNVPSLKGKRIGITAALHLVVAQRPDDELGPPTCAGPCDVATTAATYDRSVLLTLGLAFGR